MFSSLVYWGTFMDICRGLDVLLIETAPRFSQVLVKHLTRLGVTVVGTASNQREALSLLQTRRPKVLVADLTFMPERPQLSLFRKAAPEMGVIVIGTCEELDRLDLASSADECVDIDQIIPALSQALARIAAQRHAGRVPRPA